MAIEQASAKADIGIFQSSQAGLWQRVSLFADSRPASVLFCLLFTFVMTYNYVFPLDSLLYTIGIKGQDCGQMAWNLWFTNEAITSGHSPFSTNLIFHSVGANMGHHTLAAGFFPLTFLVKLLSGNDPLYPFYAFKIIILFSFTLILWFSYLTLREIGLSRWAAFIPAVGYAFSDFYMLHVIHINHLAGFFIPLTALFLIRAHKKPASANLVFAALAASASVYFTEFSIYICMAAFVFLFVAALFQSTRRELASKVREAGYRRLLTAASIFIVIVAPFGINLFKDKVRNPPFRETSHWSANLAGFFIPGHERDQSELHGVTSMTPLYGRAFLALDSRMTVGIGGFETFVGFPLLIFSVVALVKSRKRKLWICTATSLLFYVLSLGPTLKIFGKETGVLLPYSVLMRVPPFDTGRTPVRFVVMGLFFLMIVAACGVSWFEAFLAARGGTQGYRWSWLAMFFVCAWTVAEVYSPTPRRPSYLPPAGLSRIIPGPVLNLPPIQWDGYAALLQTFHHQPIATGYLARNSEAQWAWFVPLRIAFEKGGTSFCEYLRSNDFRTVVISPDSVQMPSRYSMSPLDLSRCPVNLVDLRDRGPGPFGVPQPDGSELPVSYSRYDRGKRIYFGTEEADKYLSYGWGGREIFSHWTDRGEAALAFALEPNGAQQHMATLRIFGAPYLVPGKLDAQRVVVRLNDQEIANWTLTSADPQVRAIEIPAGALREKNVLFFELPDAASPKSFDIDDDLRLLGFNLQWMEID